MFFANALFGSLCLLLAPSSGWTPFSPSPDTRIVYVSSSSGNDSYDGLSPQSPKATIAAGVSLLRHDFPDWLLLKKGDSWTSGLGQWKKSGRSANEPMLISSYGSSTQRPLLESGSSSGLVTHGGGGSPARIDHVALVGVHFLARTHGGISSPTGISWLQPSANFLIEDCKFEKYHTNLVIQGFGGIHTNFRLRRSVVVDAYSATGPASFSQGLYMSGTEGVLIEENVFDHNGWHDSIPGAQETIFNHSLYIQNGCKDVVVRGNIISNADGMQLRPGGVCEDNLFVRTSIALLLGGGNHPGYDNGMAGVGVRVVRNVILDGKNIDAANHRGWGIVMKGIGSGLISQNIVANNSMGLFPVPMDINGTVFGDNSDGCCVRNLRIERNVFSNWGGSIGVQGTPSQIVNVSFRGNEVQNEVSPLVLVSHYNPVNNSDPATLISGNNRFFSLNAPLNTWMYAAGNQSLASWKLLMGDQTSVGQDPVYPNPAASLADYHAGLGGTASHDAFMAKARLLSKDGWREAYTAKAVNAYVRESFGR